MNIRCMVGIHAWEYAFEDWSHVVTMSSGIRCGVRNTFKACGRCPKIKKCDYQEDVPVGVPMILDRR